VTGFVLKDESACGLLRRLVPTFGGSVDHGLGAWDLAIIPIRSHLGVESVAFRVIQTGGFFAEG
jgi:hypothetical protein